MEELKAEGEEGGREWDDWMAPPIQRTWTSTNSGRWAGTGGLVCCRPRGREESDMTGQLDSSNDSLWRSFGMCVFVESSDTELAGDCGVRGSLLQAVSSVAGENPLHPSLFLRPPSALGSRAWLWRYGSLLECCPFSSNCWWKRQEIMLLDEQNWSG